jgi:hypothetical protein
MRPPSSPVSVRARDRVPRARFWRTWETCFDWALSIARGKEQWRNSKPRSWSEDSERFFAALTAFDAYLASGSELHAQPEKLFQGAVADALTHVGQINMLRRLAGNRVKGENYYVAKIEAGRTGPDQMAPVSEFN